MKNQLLIIPDEVRHHKYYHKWRSFHKKNPNVLDEIIYRIKAARFANKSKVSVKTIIGSIRWDESMKIKGDKVFKINDAYTSLYGNYIAKNYPELAYMIETRKLAQI